jgi:RHS repeat-associated protein
MTTKEWNTEFGLNEYDFGARSYDPAIARWYVQDPAEQFYNPYLAIGNNPVVLYDPDGRFIPILIGAALGAYIGASTANGSFSPGQWDLSAGKTWFGMLAGGALGLAGGHAFASAAPGIAAANVSLSYKMAGFTLLGGATGGAVGYSAGFTGAVMGGANLEQAHNGGVAGAQIGVGVGSVLGMIYGLIQGGKEQYEKIEYYVDKNGNHIKKSLIQDYEERANQGKATQGQMNAIMRARIHAHDSPFIGNDLVDNDFSIYLNKDIRQSSLSIVGPPIQNVETSIKYGRNQIGPISFYNFWDGPSRVSIPNVRYINFQSYGTILSIGNERILYTQPLWFYLTISK